MPGKILNTIYKSVTHHKDVMCIVGGTIGVAIFATSFMIFTSIRDPDVSFANKQHAVSSNLLKNSATLPLIVQNKEVYGPKPDVPDEMGS